MPTRASSLIRAEPPQLNEFRYLDPPFNFNAPDVAVFPPEVTGNHLLKSLRRRLGWSTLADKKLLDFGCGIRFARTIVNLGIDVGLYAGVDVNAEAIAWLNANIESPNFRFSHVDMQNTMYNPAGRELSAATIFERLDRVRFDAVCMFSVITHQSPPEAAAIFAMLRQCVPSQGKLYFTAFIDDSVDGYVERYPPTPGMVSTYHPDLLVKLLDRTGWRVTDIYPPSAHQMHAFVCRKKRSFLFGRLGPDRRLRQLLRTARR